jgi:hypothetical protein
MSDTTPVPAGLAASGLKLWTSILKDYELDEHESALLLQACRTLDVIDALEADVHAFGTMIESPQGRKTNPSIGEARQQRITLARLLAALRLPQGEEGDHQATARPQRRGGVRAPYGIKGAVS